MGVDAAGERALPPRVLEQAADWLMRLHEDGSAVQRAQWQRWHDADPDHARAWQRAERLLALSGQVPPALAHGALQRPASPGRRAVLRSIAALLVAPLGGWLAWRLYDGAAWDASVRTAVGERRRHMLDDGSELQLDTDTAVDIAFDGQQRLLRLRHGQVLVETAPDPQQPARPFLVATPQGMVQALGTRFSVRLFTDDALLVVQQGAVRIDVGTLQRQVDAGSQLRWSQQSLLPPQPASAGTDAWTHGMLVADALPLQQLVQELGRYHRRWLRVDPAIAALPVSGAYPLDDLDRSLSMIAATYAVQVQSGLWTQLRPAATRG
ncbi:FecR domain-containing protein [Stenotrophomonas sp. S41]|uniref:FecR domain-containing protein n=1 Tax=Stenotrophomonas sp. S41 TaxID=2767464 RepID=UPI00190CE02B|nr:FecR domain-containing protein [Stenotrophomonas sp. S41]MBK0011055.1 FecR domain-containing protein [Stenotrophomonas sp. S41]